MSPDVAHVPLRRRRACSAAVLLAIGIGAAPSPARAKRHLETLHTSTGGDDGASPEPSVIAGPDGALFGATTGIGASSAERRGDRRPRG